LISKSTTQLNLAAGPYRDKTAAAYDTLINVPVNGDKDGGHPCIDFFRLADHVQVTIWLRSLIF